MSFMSRFRKGREETSDEETLGEALEGEQDEGLFMSSTPQPPAEETSAPVAPAGEAESTPAEASTGEGEPSAGPEQPEQEEAGSGGDDLLDDALSVFRETVTESEAGHLAKDLEDIPAQQLLQEVRELRDLIQRRRRSA